MCVVCDHSGEEVLAVLLWEINFHQSHAWFYDKINRFHVLVTVCSLTDHGWSSLLWKGKYSEVGKWLRDYYWGLSLSSVFIVCCVLPRIEHSWCSTDTCWHLPTNYWYLTNRLLTFDKPYVNGLMVDISISCWPTITNYRPVHWSLYVTWHYIPVCVVLVRYIRPWV